MQRTTMNITTISTKIPYNQLPFLLTLKSIDRKVFRDQFCIECGHPFMAISDKYISLIDATTPIEMLRSDDRVIEARCRFHYCKQYYRIEV